LAGTKSRRSVVQRWPSRAHGREGDGPECQIEIGRGCDNGGIVATELEDRARETGSGARTNGAAHGGRTRSGNDGNATVIDQNPTTIATAGKAPHRSRDQGLHGGVFSEGFQTTESPQMRASVALEDQTAPGKLKADMTPQTPSGCPSR
jgi:hypothetical protein